MNKRLFVERKVGFDIEASWYKSEFLFHFQVDLSSLRYFIGYDLFDISPTTLQKAVDEIIVEANKDSLVEHIGFHKHVIAVEFLPGQYDQRADALVQCIRLLDPYGNPSISSCFVLTFEEDISQDTLTSIQKYLINPVESRVKDLTDFCIPSSSPTSDEIVLVGFCAWNQNTLDAYYQEANLSMSIEDLVFIQEYFKKMNRDPYLAEIKVLDTYWSDHCRHTTFETILTDITFDDSDFMNRQQEVFDDLLLTKSKINRAHHPLTFMEMATINKRYEEHMGTLVDCEKTDEVNAASVVIDVDVDGSFEKWLFMFKNETHNHPTEIEPFGGASTCIGGAIRDPLSGRSYVYGALRFTGAADITEPIANTLPGKLPQRVISKQAAHGYSSYGNQIGLATTYVKEVFHPKYVAKRLEVGAVFGATPQENVIREKPLPGDIVLLIGGRTGRDGIGGATGSSKSHTKSSSETASSEVQKGNAPEERKIQRLFRNPIVSRWIKKANDFGAGGVSVAVGELAEGIDIYLENIKTKYDGISGLELAISESQERMAVVISKENEQEFISYCCGENVEAYKIAEITNLQRMRMLWRNQWIVDLDRTFLNTAGVRQKANVFAANPKPLPQSCIPSSVTSLEEQIQFCCMNENVASLQGLEEMFDATIGNTTILSPYGGKYQLTKVQGSVQKIPVNRGNTTTASFVTVGFNPYLSDASPYHGAHYAIVESLSKIVALGANDKNVKFSFQEYFERLRKDPTRWGKPFQALLGAYDTLKQLSLASIGGKDSMSGSYQELDVPPTLISFAFVIGYIHQVVSPEFKKENHFIYAFLPQKDEFDLVDIPHIKKVYHTIHKLQSSKTIVSSFALEHGGIAEAIIKMSLGNKIGATIQTNIPLFDYQYGGLLVESVEPIEDLNALFLGKTQSKPIVVINNASFPIEQLIRWMQTRYQDIYPICIPTDKKYMDWKPGIFEVTKSEVNVQDVRVLIPVFPGTNCEYDTKRAFEANGAIVDIQVIQTGSPSALEKSIDTFIKHLEKSHILAIPGGFSSGDEPDGSGKFIATFLKNERVKNSVDNFLTKKHLILGICNGFQALIKSGLLPFGEIAQITPSSPTLFKNHCNRHVAKFTITRVRSTSSPWLAGFSLGEEHVLPISHGEGQFIVSDTMAKELFEHNQVAFQYVDENGIPTMNPIANPNGSSYAIEGIVSKDGLILGKMAHSERYEEGLFQNIHGNKNQNIFKNAISYFRRNNNER